MFTFKCTYLATPSGSPPPLKEDEMELHDSLFNMRARFYEESKRKALGDGQACPSAPSMKIIDAKWTPKVNLLKIKCPCGVEFWHRADRWTLQCPECGHQEGIVALRQRELTADR